MIIDMVGSLKADVGTSSIAESIKPQKVPDGGAGEQHVPGVLMVTQFCAQTRRVSVVSDEESTVRLYL